MNAKRAVLAAAAAALFTAGVSAMPNTASADHHKAGETLHCEGVNGCKGQTDCSGAGQDGPGKNGCKGKGGCATVPHHSCGGNNTCKSLGGCKTDKNACKGQNECKGKGGCHVGPKK